MNLVGRLRQIMTRRNSWRELFRDEAGELKPSAVNALADLEKFCYASKPTIKVSPMSGQIDPYAMAVAEGRREVFLRIKEYLKLDDRDLQLLVKQQSDEVYNDE